MNASECIVCLGMFDGVHAGHQALLKEAARLADGRYRVVVFTFKNHPAALFSGQVSCLSQNEQRERWLKESGADEVKVVPFTRAFAAQTPEDFLGALTRAFPVRGFVAGFNYTFGAGGSGTAATLAGYGETMGYVTSIVPPVMFEGEPVSSTRIREALRGGELKKAEEMLTRPYTLRGPIVGDRQIGRQLGFPTANMDTGSMVLPVDGVYASRIRLANGETYPSVTNIGTNPTVNGQKRTVETHILRFSGDLYGTEPEVSLLAYLRAEQRFCDAHALSEAIENDIRVSLSFQRA